LRHRADKDLFDVLYEGEGEIDDTNVAHSSRKENLTSAEVICLSVPSEDKYFLKVENVKDNVIKMTIGRERWKIRC